MANRDSTPIGTAQEKGQHAAAPRAPRAPTQVERRMRWLKPLVFLFGLYPLLRLVFFGFTDGLTANPVQFIQYSTGIWALVWICITLAVTPIRLLTGLSWLLRLRRMIGLFAFFYALLHFVTYLWFDEFFNVPAIVHDVAQRPFILVGFVSFVLLLALALTSPKAVVRKLGRRWITLHRAVYAAAGFAVLHFWWMKSGKNDLFEPKIYLAVVAVLLAFRLIWALLHRAPNAQAGRC
jgi:methionine sulfoxide reductase heme-binding subunit